MYQNVSNKASKIADSKIIIIFFQLELSK